MDKRAPSQPDEIGAAVSVLAAGGLVAFPTETVYGLGADATNDRGVARIYSAKERPQFNPLIAHVAGAEAARREGIFSDAADRLAAAFWPGPLTLVVPRRSDGSVCALARAGLETIGLRMPAHPLAQALLAAFGRPVAAPSANRSGRISPTRAADVEANLGGRVDLILDGGACSVGVESTIVACIGQAPGQRLRLLRPGGIAREAIEAVIGERLASPEGEIIAPGMLASHYAPRARLRLDALTLEAGETGLDFGGRLGTGARLDLSPRGNPEEAAANLFAYLHKLDREGAAAIAVAPVPREGLGEAINDRLFRAAAPRE